MSPPVFRSALLLTLAASAAHAGETLVPATAFQTSDRGLEVTVWAASPMLRNPTNFDFDKDGRLWVAEGVNYRKHDSRDKAGDRIVVLEDTDGDGKADKTSTFVQEPFLRSPLGIAVLDNRVVVSMSPDLVVYTDVNRDRKFDPAVDKREVLLTGFYGRNHDHSLHSVTVGPDGQWYWNAGNAGAMFTDKSGKTFRMGSPSDPYWGNKPAGELSWDPRTIAGQKSDDGHVYVGGFAARMNPDGSGVRIIGHNFRNSYEQTVTSFGDVFQNDNDDPPACRTTFLLEHGNAGFVSFDGKRTWETGRRPGQSVPVAQWRQEDPGTMPAGDVYGGGSPTGIVFVEESALGKKYRGLLLSGEPGRNVVFGYFPKPEGAGFELERFDFVTSNKEGKYAGSDYRGGDKSVTGELQTFFRPSDVTVGPDGAVYVADFFDPRVGGHNDMDETLSGAIYRVAPRRFKPRVPAVEYGTIPGAIAGLKSPAVNVRGTAFAALVGFGAEAVPAATALLRDENPFVRARAVWLLAQLGPEGVAKVEPLLAHKDPQVRLVAFRATRRRLEGEADAVAALAARFATDPSAAFRRDVAVALRDLPLERSRDLLVTLARRFDGKDRTYLEAIGTGATGKEAAVYDAIAPALGDADPLRWSPAFAKLAWRLHPPQSVPAFKARALAPALPEADRRAALTAIGYVASKEAAEAMLDVAGRSDKMVKADAIWWLLYHKDGSWKPFGVPEALKKTGIYDPEKIELASATMPESASPTLTVKEVLALRGSAARGKMVAAACATCHRVGDQGVDYGPNLTGWAQRQTREVLAQSIVNPSADIAHGYGGQVIETKDGVQIHGRILSDADPVVVQSQGGVTQTVPKARVKTKGRLGRSLMLSAEEIGLDAQSVADVMAYLKTLR